MKRICSRCKDQIKRGHRFHNVTHRRLFFWTIEKPEHHDCHHPQMGPSPKTYKGVHELLFSDDIEC